MAHNHDHHDHDPHEHPQPKSSVQLGEAADAANKSLADALHLSFKLLSILMIVLLAGLMLSGIREVKTGSRGVKLLFGQIQGGGAARVLPEGLNWTAPRPVGELVTVPTDRRELKVDQFWFKDTNATELRRLQEMGMMQNEGLRPGFDGALLTGDRCLVHMRFTVYYRIATGESGLDPQEVLEYLSNVSSADDVVRSAVSAAAIRVAARRTADYLITTGREDFAREVARLAQERLSDPAHPTGIRIQSPVLIPEYTVPLAAKADFDAVTMAQSDVVSELKKATAEARSTLSRTVGEVNWKLLVGDPDNPAQVGLINQYSMLREQGKPQEAQKVLEQINDLLLHSEGDVAKTVGEALAYKAFVNNQIRSRLNEFLQLVGDFHKSPQLMLERLWCDAKDQVFGSNQVERFLVTPCQGKTVVTIGSDPEVQRRMQADLLKEEKDAKAGKTPGP